MKHAMGHQVVLEMDPESGHITGTVLGIPEIVVDGMSEGQVLADLRTAIAMALEDPVIAARTPLVTRVATVDV